MATDFTRLVDLASERNGGFVEEASDDFFAPKERLILDEPAVFKPGLYTEKGKWMDGWESRRKRTPGNDWCIVRLGFRGRIAGVDIDTSHFKGNHPPEASLDVVDDPGGKGKSRDWRPILARVPLQENSHNLFEVPADSSSTHVRLNIFPDGGVARLRVYGHVDPDWTIVAGDDLAELSCLSLGGLPLACNDEHFGRMMNLLRADNPINMGDGWETRRRRTPGHDWVVIRLGAPGVLEKLEVDTTHFKGNYPDSCSVDGGSFQGSEEQVQNGPWLPVLPASKLSADTKHMFSDLSSRGPFTHLRLNIFPDGGVARFRAFGRPESR